ncbi:MAG: long-chain-fatty-acid--CoA ligase [Chloroflexota bacterium]
MVTVPVGQDRPSELERERPWLKHYDRGVPHTLDYPRVPVQQILVDTARRFPSHTAAIFFGARLTYRQLDALSNRFANALVGMGIEKGDRVQLHLPNCPQFVIALFGILKAGAVAVPTNPLYVERELEQQVNDSGAETIVTLTRFYPTVKRIWSRTKLNNVIVTNIKDYFPPLTRLLFSLFKEKSEGHAVAIDRASGSCAWSELLNRCSDTPPRVDVQPEDVAALIYTGGTTGIPKGAMLTHASLMANTRQLSALDPELVEGKETMFAIMPFFHSYGLTGVMLQSIANAMTLIIMPRFQIDEVLKAIDKYKPTYFLGVPTIYFAINSAPDVDRYDIRSIKVCVSAAAPLPAEVVERFESLTGGHLVEGYGLTEASPAAIINPIYGRRKIGSIGVPIPDTEARIVDVETGEKEMPIGEPGELILRGPQVMKGYWNNPEETALVLRNGWLHTGDIAKRDEDGYFYMVDRKKDMIIAGGYNIYPHDIEEVLHQHPKVKEAVVVGVPDKYRGETVKAYIVLKDGETATEREMLDYCAANLAKYKAPKIVEFRPELPKTIIGKVLRRALAEEEKSKSGLQR